MSLIGRVQEVAAACALALRVRALSSGETWDISALRMNGCCGGRYTPIVDGGGILGKGQCTICKWKVKAKTISRICCVRYDRVQRCHVHAVIKERRCDLAGY